MVGIFQPYSLIVEEEGMEQEPDIFHTGQIVLQDLVAGIYC